jgi:hypothetical protein
MTDVGLEEQFVLRVPPEVAKQIHHMMKDNDLDDIEFSFTGIDNIIMNVELIRVDLSKTSEHLINRKITKNSELFE